MHLKSNGHHKISGSHHGLSKGVVCESIAMVNDVLFEQFVPQWITLPNEEEAREEARKFAELAGFPAIIWCACDGTHVECMYIHTYITFICKY